MRKLPVVLLILMLLCASTGLCAFRPAAIGDLFHKGASGFDVRAYGAVGDGSTDDEPAFTLAIAAAADGRVIVPEAVSNYKLSANVTVPAGVTIVFQQGGLLSIDNTFTFTVNGTLQAGQYQIFSGAGSVSLTSASAKEFLPQWWGAVGDGSNDDTSAIQAAIDATEAINGTVFLPAGVYKTTSALTIQKTIRMYGETSESSVIYVFGGGNGIELTTPVDGDVDSTFLAYFRLKADTNTGSGITLDGGSRRVTMYELWIGSNSDELGVHFANGIHITGTNALANRVVNCYLFGNSSYGVLIEDGAHANRVTSNWIHTSLVGVRVDNAEAAVIFNNTIQYQSVPGTDFHGVELEFSPRSTVTHNYFESSGTGTHYSIYITHVGGNSFALKINSNYYNALGTEAIFGLGGTTKRQTVDSHSIQFADELGQAASYYSAIYWENSEIDSSIKDLLVKTDETNNANGHFRINNTKMVLTGQKARLELSYPHFQTGLGGFGGRLENKFTHSEAFGNAAWIKSALTVTSNNTGGVDGRATGDQLVQTGDSGNISQNITGVDNGQIINASVYLRDQRPSDFEVKLRWYNVTDGVEAAVDTFTVAEDNRWRRYELRHTNSTGGTKEYRFEIYPSDESFTENVFAWGAQCVIESTNAPNSASQGQGYPYIRTFDTSISIAEPGSTVRTLVASEEIYVAATSPEVIVYNTTNEDSDGGREGSVRFKGVQSGNELTTLAMIRGSHDGAVDDEKGKLEILVNDTNDGDTPTLVASWDSAGELTLTSGTGIGEFSTDGALAGNSDDAVPTEQAVKTYVDGLTKYREVNLAKPPDLQAADDEWLIWRNVPANLTISRLEITLDASGNEITGDIVYVDAFIGQANAVIINAFDTTSGVVDDSTITVGAVPAGKDVIVDFDGDAPNAAITQLYIKLTYTFD